MREIRGLGRIVAGRGQVEQDRVGKYEFSALLPENHCCLWLHTTCAADHTLESCSAALWLCGSAALLRILLLLLLPVASPSKDQQATTA